LFNLAFLIALTKNRKVSSSLAIIASKMKFWKFIKNHYTSSMFILQNKILQEFFRKLIAKLSVSILDKRFS